MRRKRLVVLAVAARSGRVAYVLLIDGRLKQWQRSCNAALTNKLAAKAMAKWISECDPDVIVLEKHQTANRKSDTTQGIIRALYRAAKHSPATVTQVVRVQHYPNKFIEALALAQRYPELKPSVPDRNRLWEREPRNLVFFEAVALAGQSGFLPEEE